MSPLNHRQRGRVFEVKIISVVMKRRHEGAGESGMPQTPNHLPACHALHAVKQVCSVHRDHDTCPKGGYQPLQSKGVGVKPADPGELPWTRTNTCAAALGL